MNVDKILAISGKPGLFELKIQTRSGFVAESMIDGKRITVSMRSNVSLLSEISMYFVKHRILKRYFQVNMQPDNVCLWI